ncbi:N-acetyl sugar amidotransferase [Sphingomonas sp. SUN039]|uniref:N-acetyl sugar amidotransferase n=1 Tax=Sphingomonas sp. SUN039 TaxID=2937787 RepID=UPI002164C3F5|nr:N-acetyl sugar amidotransferase [Sphingomonas sp. SUN039]UVO52847.1 N-acetyl sugar amidotransferase [Sphingomonas sp. SUN039]
MTAYQVCSNCVMDTTDENISFDADGVCDHCHNFRDHVAPNWHTDERGEAELMAIAEKIRADGKDREFDCILGMSGGFDSSYMLHIAATKMKLRPLVFHVDGGWNTQVAVHNIECVVEKLGLDLYTEVINWEEMKDFQLAFFKSGVPHIDIPQDMAFIATLYKFAAKHNIKYILNGTNYSTECVRNPLNWIYYGTDMAQLKDIQKKFGTVPLKDYPISSILYHKLYLRYIRRISVIKPLNLGPYIKADAQELMSREYGWTPYPQKHFESRFTRFYEGYWLPARFGYDTRKIQFSSLILTGQMTREAALDALSRPAIPVEEIPHELDFIATKLGITTDELIGYRDMPLKSHRDYKSNEWMFNLGAKALRLLGVERSIKR